MDALVLPSPNGPRFDIDHEGVGYRSLTIDEMGPAGVPVDVVLGVFKSYLKTAVDAKAEAIRSLMTTPGSGQAMEYQEAQSQAAAALKAPASATPAKYPMLAATIGIDIDPSTGAPATDVVGVARSVDAARDAWVALGSIIRNVRLAGKKAISDAPDLEAAAAAYAAIVWPTLG